MYRKKIEVIRQFSRKYLMDVSGWEFSPGRMRDLEGRNTAGNWEKIENGEYWEARGTEGCFRASVTIPEEASGETVYLEISLGGESTVWLDGAPYHGLDPNHDLVPLNLTERSGSFELVVESYGRFLPEEYFAYSRDRGQPYRFNGARLCVINRVLRNYHTRISLIRETAEALTGTDAGNYLLNAIGESLGLVDFSLKRETEFAELVSRADTVLEKKVFSRNVYPVPGKLGCLSHSHIDIVWLWRFKETVWKTARTFSTILRLMEEFPEFRYAQSQPLLYQTIKEHYPELFRQIKERVREGRWELVGSMWVEADGNIPSGEAYVRQFLYGREFYRKEFGILPRTEWLPDIFGFTGSLPQIMKKSGIDYFFATKLHVNETNTFPHTSFWWEGIDGTKILAHMPPSNYIGTLKPGHLRRHWEMYTQKTSREYLAYPFGYGDGGGGPDRVMAESFEPLAKMPGLPSCRLTGAEEFFRELEKDSAGLPVWRDELYLESCRGTYTSEADIKRMNRQLELLYRDAEFFSVYASLAGAEYPVSELKEGWLKVLFNQFHDILPGSSVTEAYDDARQLYREAREIGTVCRDRALKVLAAGISTSPFEKPFAVFNSLEFVRDDIVKLNVPAGDRAFGLIDRDGSRLPSVLYQDPETGSRQTWFRAERVPAMGYKVLGFSEVNAPQGVIEKEQIKDTLELNTPYYRAVLNRSGQFLALTDLRNNREVIPEGSRGNEFQFFTDFPERYEAWDIDEDTLKSYETVEYAENAVLYILPDMGWEIRVTRRYRSSEVRQRIRFYTDMPRIDFVTNADWREKQVLLKAAFPVEIYASRAAYDIAFGNIERPTHRNTSWDRSKFEVSAHKWADLSETGYGVSILNDCKYGYDIKDNVMRITLIKCAEWPDPEADLGAHEFTYSLFPHTGGWREGGTVREADRLNSPLLWVPSESEGGDGTLPRSLLEPDSENVIVEAVKQAEDGKGFIIRLSERYGRRGGITCKTSFPQFKTTECDLTEQPFSKAVTWDSGAFTFFMKPFEIKTFRIVMVQSCA